MDSEPINGDRIVFASFFIKIACTLFDFNVLQASFFPYIFRKSIKDETFNPKFATQAHPILGIKNNCFRNTHNSPSQFIFATRESVDKSSFVYTLVDSTLRCPKTSETDFMEEPVLINFDAHACLKVCPP